MTYKSEMLPNFEVALTGAVITTEPLTVISSSSSLLMLATTETTLVTQCAIIISQLTAYHKSTYREHQ